MTRWDRGVRLAAGTVAVGAAGLSWAVFERGWYVLRRVEVPVLPPGSAPVRVLHVSDLHLTSAQDRAVAWVRALVRLEPDVVVNTGDNFGALDALEPVLEAFEPLSRVPGAFVFGSNDFYGPHPKNPAKYLIPESRRRTRREPPPEDLPAAELAAAWRDAGWVDLDNARGAVTLSDGRVLDMVGLADPHMKRDRMPPPAPPRGMVRIGVVHAPYARALDALAADGASLLMAGHTHGGQLCLPVYGALVTNCDLDRRRVKGLSWWGAPPSSTAKPTAPDAGARPGAWLHVSAGLGTSKYAPVRFACRPEATLLTLVARRE